MRKITIILLLISSLCFGQSETHNFTTYDTIYNGPGQVWRIRISRPVNMFTAGHPDTASRPAIITMPGLGEVGTNYLNLQVWGPHYWLNNGWDGSVTTGSGRHYPILITVLAQTANPRASSTIPMVQHLLNTYRIKRSSVHFAGLSMGAFTWAAMINAQIGAGNETGMALAKSLVLLQGAGQGATSGLMGSAVAYDATGYRAFGHWAKKYGGKFFGLEGTADGRNVWMPRDNINDSVPGAGYFSYENYGGGAHCCWNTFYNPSVTDWQCVAPITNANIAINGSHANSMGTYKKGDNLFTWMFKQGDTSLVGGVINQPPQVFLELDKTVYYPADSVELLSAVVDEDGMGIVYSWTKTSGTGSTIVSPDSASTMIRGLTEGVYTYSLNVTDTGSLTGSDAITITVTGDTSTYSATTLRGPLVGNGEYQDLFIDTNNHLWGLGNLSNIGVNGGGTVGVPQRVLVTPSDLKFRYVTGGLHGAGAIDTAGYVWIVGDNDQGQHGQGNLTSPVLVPEKITVDSAGSPFKFVRDLVAYFVKDGVNGYNGFYAVKQDGTLWGWGYMVKGMRGDGTAGDYKLRPVQIKIPGGRLVQQVIAGQFAMVLCTDGTVWTWGEGATNNNLGYAGSISEKWYPHQLSGLTDVRMIAGGLSWNFALTNSGTLYGWGGYGDFMGNSNGLPISTPTVLSNITNNLPLPISSIVTNSASVHVILNDGTLWGWGDNGQGTVGDGRRIVFTIDGGNPFDRGNLQIVLPVHIAPGIIFDTIFGSSVYTYHSYARDTSGNLYCWGRGKGSVLANQLRPSSSGIVSTYGNSWDIAYPTPVNPFTITTSYIQTSDYCVKIDGSLNPCNQYTIPANISPVANAGSNQTVSTTSCTLNATLSTDDVFISRYEWRQLTSTNGTSASIDLPASKTPTVRSLADGVYTFELLVEDNGWATARDTVTITVNQTINQSPVISSLTASSDTIQLPISIVKLTGVATDPDGTIASYSYVSSFAPGGSSAVFNTPTSDTCTISGLTVAGSYGFTLSVTDNDGSTVTADITIIVTPASSIGAANTYKINIYGGVNPILRDNWNNFLASGTVTSIMNNIIDTTGATSNVSVSISQQLSVVTNALQTGVMCPDTVLLNASYSTSGRELKIINLENGASYSIELYCSRVSNNSSTTATINGSAKSVTVNSNTSNKILFTDIQPTSGTITVTLTGAPNYLNGFKVIRQGTSTPINTLPVANAGVDKIITLPLTQAQLDGSASSDADGTIVSYLWQLISSEYPISIDYPDSSITVISALTQVGLYTFRLTVTDNNGGIATDNVQILVLPRERVRRRFTLSKYLGRGVEF